MNNFKNIFDSLLKAETEEEVHNIVTKNAIFQNDENWRGYGDVENNWGPVGAQQDEATPALVEKITNSIDSLLLLKCRLANIDPKSTSAPDDIFVAAEKFFGVKKNKLHEHEDLSALAQNALLIATGPKGFGEFPSIAIADFGEGQNPKDFSHTFLSLNKSNKSDIPFVTGKFNMGGTGVTRFCGRRHSYQLLVSKRCPELSGADNLWGFTLIRRLRPSGTIKNSVIQYFAPDGSIPTIDEQFLSLLPVEKGNEAHPYRKPMQWGTYIKLYEYQLKDRTNIVLDLYRTLNRLLYKIPLPIRLVECRGYGGHTPFSNLMGMDQRLQTDRSELLDNSFSPATNFTELGPLGKVEINFYLFKYEIDKKTLRRWVGSDAIYFTINGQTHARLSEDFLTRAGVKLDYLKNYLLINIDCTNISNDLVEDLFMTNRCHMVKGDLRSQIEDGLESVLKSHPGLRDKNELYRQNKVKDKIADETIKLDVLNNIISSNPMLAKLFGKGAKLSDPSKRGQHKNDFEGVRFPTYFKIAKKHEGILKKECPLKSHCVVLFETDAQNDYLSRIDDAGKLIVTNDHYIKNTFLYNGILHLEVYPSKENKSGDVIEFNVQLTSPNALNGFFEEQFEVIITPQKEEKKKRKKHEPPKVEGLAIPNIYEVKKDDYDEYDWNEENAIQIRQTESSTDAYINIDNIHFRREIDRDFKNAEIIKEQFTWGMVIYGLAMKEVISKVNINGEGEEMFQTATKSLARVILPIIRGLSKLDEV